MPAQPFDAAAPSYDRDFTATRLGRWLREAVWAYLAEVFRPGDHVLELGCGTGEDAVWLAGRGLRVTATDASAAMLDVARAKAQAGGQEKRIEFVRLDMAESVVNCQWSMVNGQWSRSPAGPEGRSGVVGGQFDGVVSNFGALNCLPDRRPLAAALARCVRPGGQAVLVLMGPACPWEIGWHLLHGQPRNALRRFRRNGLSAHAGGGGTVQVWYPSPRTLAAEFAPHFAVRRLAGIGSLLPPSYLTHLVERRPDAFARVAAADRRLGSVWPFTWLNDHYLVILERQQSTP